MHAKDSKNAPDDFCKLVCETRHRSRASHSEAVQGNDTLTNSTWQRHEYNSWREHKGITFVSIC